MGFWDHSDAVLAAIRAFLEAHWTDTPLCWPNEDIDNPDAGPFVAVEIQGTLFAQMSIGAAQQAGNRWDEEGTLWLHVCVPRGHGALAARGAARALAELFRGATLLGGRLEFRDAAIGPGETADEDGNWFRLPVGIDWRLMDA